MCGSQTKADVGLIDGGADYYQPGYGMKFGEEYEHTCSTENVTLQSFDRKSKHNHLVQRLRAMLSNFKHTFWLYSWVTKSQDNQSLGETLGARGKEPLSESTHALLADAQAAFYEAKSSNALYTATVKEGNTNNAYLIRLLYFNRANQGERQVLCMGKQRRYREGCSASRVEDAIMPSGDQPVDFTPVFKHEGKAIQRAQGLNLTVGSTIKDEV